MLTIKISSRGSGKNLNLSQFTGNESNEWRGCRFFINSDVELADAWFVSEDVDDDETSCAVPGGDVYFLTAETSWPSGYYDENPGRSAFLDQFAAVFTCHDVFRPNVTATLPFLPWMVNANHGPSISAAHHRDVAWLRGLTSLPKSRDLSVFCSHQTWTEGHRLRLRFVEKLKEHFGERLDWFGNGIQPLAEKWDGIAPYRYHLVLENHAAPNVITEKLWDSYLGLAYPIYWGAPNVRDYVPGESLTTINVMDLAGSIEVIETLVVSDRAEVAQPHVIAARKLVLGDLHYLSRIAAIAKGMSNGTEPRVKTTVSPMSSYPQVSDSVVQRVMRRLRP